MQKVKEVLVVEEAEKTKVEEMKTEIDRLTENNCIILGCVVL